MLALNFEELTLLFGQPFHPYIWHVVALAVSGLEDFLYYTLHTI